MFDVREKVCDGSKPPWGVCDPADRFLEGLSVLYAWRRAGAPRCHRNRSAARTKPNIEP